MVKVFVPKDSPGIPDSYKVKITYITGKTDELELASHQIRDKVWMPTGKDDKGRETGSLAPSSTPFLEYITKDDLWGWIPMTSIQRLEFDQSFSKMMAEKEKQAREEAESLNRQKEILK